MPYLFVYGTLKHGCTLHPLIADTDFLGQATIRGYTIIDNGVPLAVPALRDCIIRGELYRVTYEHLRRLDVVESGYVRVRMRVYPRGGPPLLAHVYIYPSIRTDRCVSEEYVCRQRPPIFSLRV